MVQHNAAGGIEGPNGAFSVGKNFTKACYNTLVQEQMYLFFKWPLEGNAELLNLGQFA